MNFLMIFHLEKNEDREWRMENRGWRIEDRGLNSADCRLKAENDFTNFINFITL
jgi:hypothetical protein